MENVIKQGYLKKGNSSEGASRGVFSGLLEKMTPRKWYMLVVRNRVPFLEQYEREVDVFSSTPSVAYDLSVCTSISRTMASSARTFTFVIVCPEELIELIASTREQMVDWCNTLERTLSSLGILRNDKEEHIYTFCPAVVNTVGRTSRNIGEDEGDREEGDREEGDREEELGAVGGAPAPSPPPPRSQVPPVPSHPPPFPRMLSEPAGNTASSSRPPAPLPSALRGQAGRSASPLETESMVSSAPPSPHVSTPLPPAASPPSSRAPPLPPGRPPGSAVGAQGRPPPLPPGRPLVPLPVSGVQERGLPPVPPPPSASEPGRPTEPSSASNSEGEEEESSDYSSDFVSGAFWEINRKIPIATARCAVLPPKRDGLCSSSGVSEAGGLDEGYTDLSTVSALRKSDPPVDKTNTEYAKVNKPPRPGGAAQQTNGTEGRESTGSSEPSTPQSVVSGDLTPSDSRVVSPTWPLSDAVSSSTLSEEEHQAVDNVYAPFPGESENSSMASSKHSDYSSENDPEASEEAVTSTDTHDRSPDDDVQSDCMYASAAEASTLFPDECIPPLPPRQDSLSTWKEDGSGDVFHTAASTGSSTSEPQTSPTTETATPRPIPRRRTIHPTSHPITRMEQDESQVRNMVRQSEIPPLPPPRWGVPQGQAQSMDGGGGQPPPLPARKTQSVRGQRPMSLTASYSAALESEESFPTNMWESFSGSTSLTRQQSFGNGDSGAAENHLRQRQRLDRVHSINSVISLKQSQAEILRQEMELPGVTVTVSLRAAQGIALVDCNNAVCLVGWNQKDFPSLHGKFHIGDQLISICNVKVTSAAMGLKMLKHPPLDLVEMLVKRTPHAKVMAIRRVAEGQSIGIKRNGGTAEILYVDPNGLAAENGLPLYAPGVLNSQSRSLWVLTEINSRHLNLFFKDNEIEHRLNAVGKEITIVVQPSDYIGELKKQLKRMKNYKNYIVQ